MLNVLLTRNLRAFALEQRHGRRLNCDNCEHREKETETENNSDSDNNSSKGKKFSQSLGSCRMAGLVFTICLP